MKKFGNIITVSRNGRGVYDLDTVKGCKYGMALNNCVCYGACYAATIARRYGYDFSNSVLRRFESNNHEKLIIDSIKKINSSFIRIGTMGDPSECWGHTIDICNKIKCSGKQIVIVTKHFEEIPMYLLCNVKKLGLIINTSISSLDTDDQIKIRLEQYKKLKEVCTSVLRVVTCNFNLSSMLGIIYNDIQNDLLKNDSIVETALRIGINHELVKNNVVHLDARRFVNKKTTLTLRDNNIYLGKCQKCHDMCGLKYNNL